MDRKFGFVERVQRNMVQETTLQDTETSDEVTGGFVGPTSGPAVSGGPHARRTIHLVLVLSVRRRTPPSPNKYWYTRNSMGPTVRWDLGSLEPVQVGEETRSQRE